MPIYPIEYKAANALLRPDFPAARGLLDNITQPENPVAF